MLVQKFSVFHAHLSQNSSAFLPMSEQSAKITRWTWWTSSKSNLRLVPRAIIFPIQYWFRQINRLGIQDLIFLFFRLHPPPAPNCTKRSSVFRWTLSELVPCLTLYGPIVRSEDWKQISSRSDTLNSDRLNLILQLGKKRIFFLIQLIFGVLFF